MVQNRRQFMMTAIMMLCVTSCGEATPHRPPPFDRALVISVSGDELAYSWSTEPGVISTRLEPTTTNAVLQKLAEGDVDCDLDKVIILADSKNDAGLKTFTTRLKATGCSGFVILETAGKARE
ncbi:MAG: hypothetical protein ACSHX3_08450 [Litorimonas sp.]